jgi:hypothetical protein
MGPQSIPIGRQAADTTVSENLGKIAPTPRAAGVAIALGPRAHQPVERVTLWRGVQVSRTEAMRRFHARLFGVIADARSAR